MRNTLLTILLTIGLPLTASAQFYTVTQGNEMFLQKENEEAVNVENKEDTVGGLTETLSQNTVLFETIDEAKKSEKTPKSNEKVYLEKDDLPELTIPNLYEEIRRAGILYPKIVLAQAILETGWFRSSVCREKHNLFGLTNPRTGKYYEFSHWTESVRVYYTKVQYRYRGGNYLLWLKRIGYAEDKNYVRSLIKVLRQLS